MENLNEYLKVHFTIGPINCGKTEMALNLFTATPEEGATFVTLDSEVGDVRDYLYRNGFANLKYYVKSVESFLLDKDMNTHLYGVQSPCIIFDNYFQYTLNERMSIYKKVHSVLSRFDVHIFGTPHRLYDSAMLDQIRDSKQRHSLLKAISTSASPNLREMFYNFLTEPNAVINKIFRPITKEALKKYKNDPELLLTRHIGIYEKN